MITSVRTLLASMVPQIAEKDFVRARICHKGALCEIFDYDDWWSNLGGVEVSLHTSISLSYGWSMIVNFLRDGVTEDYVAQTWQGCIYTADEIISHLAASLAPFDVNTKLTFLYIFIERYQKSWPKFSD